MTILIRDTFDLLPRNVKAFPLGLIDHTKTNSNHEYENDFYDPFTDDTPPIFFPSQLKWLQDESRIKIWEKSRRIGASWCDALDSVITASVQNGMNCYYCGYNYSMAYQYIHDCAYWARHLNLICSDIDEFLYVDEDKAILSYKIKFASGFEIAALSARPENFRSKQGKVTLDEFAFQKRTENNDVPKQLLKASLALLMWGGRLAILSTHNGIGTEFNRLINAVKTGERTDISLHRTTFKEAVAEGLFKRICNKTNTQWTQEAENAWVEQTYIEQGVYAAEELDCIPSSDSDILFDYDAITRNAIGKWHRKRKSNNYYMLAVDPNFGSSGGDYHVSDIINITQFPLAVEDEYSDNTSSTVRHKEQTIRLIKQYKPCLIAVESNSGGKLLAEDLIREFPRYAIEQLRTSHTNKIINTDSFAGLVESNNFIYPPDWKGIAEMKDFSKKLRESLTGHDDHVMANAVGAAFLAQALETLPIPSDFRSGKPRYNKHEN